MNSWINYIRFVRSFPDSDKTVRGLFKRGIVITKDNK
jgi:hypothetical protein